MSIATRYLYCAIIALAVLIASTSLAAPLSVESVPNVHLRDKNSYVSDPAKILTPDALAAVNRAAASLEQRTGVEMAVVVLKDVGDNDPREFASDLFRHWGLGKKGQDNGLLILLVTEPPERSVIFETGYGLEGVLPDVVCYRLQQRYMIPDFSAGDFSAGLVKGVNAVSTYLTSDTAGRTAMTPAPQKKAQEEGDTASTIIFVLLILAFLYFAKRNPRAAMAILASLGRGGRGGRGGGGGFGGGGSWGGGASGGGGARSRF